MKNTEISAWYEVRIGTMQSSHCTLDQAQEEIDRMSAGCPDVEAMSDENREYWKKVSVGARIYFVEKTETLIK